MLNTDPVAIPAAAIALAIRLGVIPKQNGPIGQADIDAIVRRIRAEQALEARRVEREAKRMAFARRHGVARAPILLAKPTITVSRMTAAYEPRKGSGPRPTDTYRGHRRNAGRDARRRVLALMAQARALPA